MFCIYCGKELVDDSAFCIYCGKQVHRENVTSDGRSKQQTKESMNEEYGEPKNKSTSGSGVICPKCGSTRNQVLNKTNVSSIGGGYDCCTGGLGAVCLGPVGLLLGLCGSKQTIYSTNQTSWVCNDCGHEFFQKKDIQQGMKLCSIFAYAFLVFNILFLLLSGEIGSSAGIMALLIVGTAALLWYAIPLGCKRGGYEHPKDVLGNDYAQWEKGRKTLGYVIVASAILDILVALIFAT